MSDRDDYRQAQIILRQAISENKARSWKALCNNSVDKDPWGLAYTIVTKMLRYQIPHPKV